MTSHGQNRRNRPITPSGLIMRMLSDGTCVVLNFANFFLFLELLCVHFGT